MSFAHFDEIYAVCCEAAGGKSAGAANPAEKTPNGRQPSGRDAIFSDTNPRPPATVHERKTDPQPVMN